MDLLPDSYPIGFRKGVNNLMTNTAQQSARKRADLHKNEGFTLIELLVVIAILAILAAVVILLIKPGEILAQGRDTTRMSDLATLQTAINVAVQEATTSGSATLCTPPAAAPCAGNSSTGTQSNNGTGWVKVNIGAQKSVTLPALPKDPTNVAPYVYDYSTNGAGTEWEINGVLESEKFASKMANDGGSNTAVYEIGTDLTIIQ